MRTNHIHVSRTLPFLATTKRPDATLGLGCAANGLNVERDGAVWIEYFAPYSTFFGASMIALLRGSKDPSFSAKVSSVPKELLKQQHEDVVADVILS